MNKFSLQEISRAAAARHGYDMVVTPSPSNYEGMVRGNLIKKCPVTAADLTTAQSIHGIDVHSLQEETTQRQPRAVVTDFIAIPGEIRNRHRTVVLTADIVFIRRLPFMVTLSRGICFGKIQYLRSWN